MVAFVSALSGCADTKDVSRVQMQRICALSKDAFSNQRFDELRGVLENEFGVPRAKIRITEQGVFIPKIHRFVEEEGYFLLRPGASVGGKEGDPAFEAIADCAFRYQIRG